MDVGNPSTFERLSIMFEGSVDKMRKWIRGVRITDQETRETMSQVYRDTGVLIDPHTAVGVLASRRYRRDSGFVGHILTLATAHPGKFVDIVQEATGVAPDLPATLEDALSKKKQATTLTASLEVLREFLLAHYG
jgi:threonine synthase